MGDPLQNSGEQLPRDGDFRQLEHDVLRVRHNLGPDLEAPPATATAKGSKTEIVAYLKGAFRLCDGVYSGFTDAHLNDPADFWGFKTNKMFILTQAGNHDALHYGNLVTYLRLNGLEPSGGWF